MANSNSFRNPAPFGPLQALWRNPSAIAAIASLGLHGLLFVVLPLMPRNELKAEEAEIKDPVGVTELTPAEQQRLPDMVTQPPLELPPMATLPKNGSLFTLPSQSQPNTRTSITPSADSLLAPPPPSIFIPPIFPPSQLPSFSTIQIAPLQPAPVRPRPAAPPAQSPAASPIPSVSPSGSPSPEAADSASAGVESPASPTAPNQADEAPVAADQQPSPARTETDIRQDLLARQQELRELYSYKSEGTSVESANSAFLGWYSAAMGRDYAEGEAKPNQEEVTADYPRIGCPLKKSQRAVVGVVVGADGQVMGDPKLLQSSGYGIFNQEALAVAKTHAFKTGAEGKQIYLLGVNFKYSDEVCPPGLNPAAPAG